jgi:hypothetical protein
VAVSTPDISPAAKNQDPSLRDVLELSPHAWIQDPCCSTILPRGTPALRFWLMPLEWCMPAVCIVKFIMVVSSEIIRWSFHQLPGSLPLKLTWWLNLNHSLLTTHYPLQPGISDPR